MIVKPNLYKKINGIYDTYFKSNEEIPPFMYEYTGKNHEFSRKRVSPKKKSLNGVTLTNPPSDNPLSDYPPSSGNNDIVIPTGLVKETNETNFGHEKLIWQYNGTKQFDWDQRKVRPSKNTYELCAPKNPFNNSGSSGRSGSSGSSGSSNRSGSSGRSGSIGTGNNSVCAQGYTGFQTGGSMKFKHEFINENYDSFVIHKDQKKYCELNKYILTNSTNVAQIYDPNQPTLVLGLFAVTCVLYKKEDPKEWTKKYILGQLKLILGFKLKFPQGNVRVYFDSILTEQLKDNKLELTPSLYENDELAYQIKPYENSTKDNYDVCDKYINQYCKRINSFINSDEYKKMNNLIKFLSLYDFACQTRLNSEGNLEFNQCAYRELFACELRGIFVDQIKLFGDSKSYDMNKTEGFIGQHIRFITLTQGNYLHKGVLIPRARHVLFRDGQANSTGHYDYEYINELNKSAKSNKLKVCLLPSSITYDETTGVTQHDNAKCGDEVFQVAPIAGELQLCNFTDDKYFFTDMEILQFCSLPFTISSDESKVLLHEYFDYHKYKYGLDEYMSTVFYQNPEFRKYCLFFQDMWIENLIRPNFEKIKYGRQTVVNPMRVALALLTNYLIVSNKINKDENNWRVIIREIEKLRYRSNLANDESFKKYAQSMSLSNEECLDKFGILLSVFPNVYHIRDFLYMVNYTFECNDEDNFSAKNYVAKTMASVGSEIYFAFNNVDKYCNVLKSDIDWCLKPLYFKDHVGKCSLKQYGYYDVEINENDFVLRKPQDIRSIINRCITPDGKVNFSPKLLNKSMSGGSKYMKYLFKNINILSGL